jgi:hypothetical protein
MLFIRNIRVFQWDFVQGRVILEPSWAIRTNGGTILGHLRAKFGDVGLSWGILGQVGEGWPSWGTYLATILRLSWGHLKPFLGHPGPIFGLSWAMLDPSWGTSGQLAAILGLLEAILGHLGAILGHVEVILGPSWAILGPSWAMLGPSLAYIRFLGQCMADPKILWATLFFLWRIHVFVNGILPKLGPSCSHLGPV